LQRRSGIRSPRRRRRRVVHAEQVAAFLSI
jgi:hypothetical protein